jgi:perosamine synthetase
MEIAASNCNAPAAGTDAPATIPLCEPQLAGNETAYLRRCIETNWVSYAGPYVQQFEQMIAEYLGVGAAVACVSGTAALHLALLAAGVQAGDEVLVSDLTFLAPVNAIRYCGARPVLMDAECRYGQMDTGKVLEFLGKECEPRQGRLYHRRTGRPVGAILPVHMLGHPVELQPLLEAGQRWGVPIVEDATEALGSQYLGRRVGCHGDIGCLSFNANKVITTGGGGMVISNRPDWAARVRHLSTQAKAHADEYIHDAVGYNYRLTNLQAAVGVAQMEQLDGFLAAKRRLAQRYREGLGDIAGLELPEEAPWAHWNRWLYTVRIDAGRFGMEAGALRRHLAGQAIQTRPLWRPAHLQAPYQDAEQYRLEVTPRLYGSSLSLPSSSGLTTEQQERVIAAIHQAARVAPRAQ